MEINKDSNESLSYSMIIDKKDKLSYINIKNVEPQKIIGWVDDKRVIGCYNCNNQFSFFQRKHHCRYCGKIFCYICSNYFIKIPSYLKKEDTLSKSSWHFFNNNLERVCISCIDLIKIKIKTHNLINVFLYIDFTLIDYSIISCVCKKWKEVAINYFSIFRQLQYNLYDYKYTKIEKKMLWDNRSLIIGHSKYLLCLIKSINWEKINKSNCNFLLKINNNKRMYSCWSMMCGRLCNIKLSIDDIICILDSNINNCNINKYILHYLKSINDYILICLLPNLLSYIKFSNEKENSIIVSFLIGKCKTSYKVSNYIFNELSIQMLDYRFYNLYNNIKIKLLNSLDKKIAIYIKQTINDTKNFPDIINKINKSKFYKHSHDFILTIRPELKCISINKNIIVKDSFTKPIIAELKCIYKTNKNIFKKKNYKLMLKNEDVRTDYIIINIIRIMDYILKKDESLDLHIITYNILPIDINKGLIEIIQDSKTLYEIKKDNFTIQNWIIENNPNVPIDILRKRFTLSCAAYCVISYLLGFGDRHLDNIMISKEGFLFHIDFSYVLGISVKIMVPEIRITPDMIDAMGGINSKNYELFQDLCIRSFNCLRRHSNLFFILLSQLDKIKPKILNGKYSYEFIKKHIISRFLPGENYTQAKLIFNTIVKKHRSSSYSEKLIDFCHENSKENTVLSSITNVSNSILNLLYKSK